MAPFGCRVSRERQTEVTMSVRPRRAAELGNAGGPLLVAGVAAATLSTGYAAPAAVLASAPSSARSRCNR